MQAFRPWPDQLDKLTAEFQQNFGALPAEVFFWKPAPDQWSVAEVIVHLTLTAEKYELYFEEIRAGKHFIPWWGKLPFLPTWTGNFILRLTRPSRKGKIKTFPKFEPHIPAELGDPKVVMGEFVATQKKLREFTAQSEPFVQENYRITSPFSSLVVYPLETAFDIIVAHEWRHLAQAKRVLRTYAEISS